jgi:hypothetical protein
VQGFATGCKRLDVPLPESEIDRLPQNPLDGYGEECLGDLPEGYFNTRQLGMGSNQRGCLLPHNILRRFILPQPHETAVAQVSAVGPLDKLKLAYEHRR